jgi:hypothetical protein
MAAQMLSAGQIGGAGPGKGFLAPGCGDRVGAYEAAMAKALGDGP